MSAEILYEHLEAKRDQHDEERRELGLVAEAEETQAQLAFVREQRDALLLAVKAADLFHSVGALVALEDLQQWVALTGGEGFSALGLHRFIRAQLQKARVA